MLHEIPRVTPHEFMHKIRPQLSSHGFTQHELDQVEMAFHEHLEKNPHFSDWRPGVDKEQLAQTMAFMKKHPSTTAVGPHQWEIVERIMTREIDEAPPRSPKAANDNEHEQREAA